MPSDIFSGFPGYMGWIPDTADDRDFKFEATYRVPWGSEEYLRTTEEYDNCWNKVYDQGSTQSCTANAVAAAYSFEFNRFKGITADTQDAFSPSRSFIYYNARKGLKEDSEDDEQELVPDGGSYIRLAMRSLQKFGVCQDVTWPLRPESIKWYPGPYAFYEAQKHAIRAYQYKRLDVKRGDKERSKIKQSRDTKTMDADGDTVLYNLRSCLSEGNPVIFGFTFYDNMTFLDKQNSKEFPKSSRSDWCLPDVPKDRRHQGPATTPGGHAVVAIGFLDHKKKDRSGWVLCQNSWGSDKQIGGCPFFWMPYNYITDFTATMDFWTMDFSNFESKL